MIPMRTLDHARAGVGALAVGLAQSALDEAAQFAKERHQFGQPIIAFQAVQHMLANMATKIVSAHRANRRKDVLCTVFPMATPP